MTISEKGLSLIKSFEGLRLEAYLDTAGIATIGYGTIIYPAGNKVQMGDVITTARADEYLLFEVENKTKSVNILVTAALNQNQFDALCSFTYNVGSGALAKSTLLKRVNVNPADITIREAFGRFNKSGGKVTNGLVKRRSMEADLYFTAIV